MREIDSDALLSVLHVLGIGNPATATLPAVFDDENLQQVFDVAPAIRRARVSGATGEGIWSAQIENAHVAAGQIVSTITPYNLAGGPTAFTALNGFPDPVPNDMDVWLIGAACLYTTGQLDNARLTVQVPGTGAAFGATGNVSLPYYFWDTDMPIGATGALSFGANSLEGMQLSRRAVRVPRGSEIGFTSVNGAGVGWASIFCDMHLGLFPASLGQDGLA